MAGMMAARDAFGKALVDLGKVDPRVVVLDADLGVSTKASMFQDAYPDRFFQIGIAEQNMMGIAAGLAHMRGFIAGATRNGPRCASAASVRTLSASPCASFASVFAVSGATTSRSACARCGYGSSTGPLRARARKVRAATNRSAPGVGTGRTSCSRIWVSLAATSSPSLCAVHVRQFGGESPLSNLMEVKD